MWHIHTSHIPATIGPHFGTIFTFPNPTLSHPKSNIFKLNQSDPLFVTLLSNGRLIIIIMVAVGERVHCSEIFSEPKVFLYD